MLLIIDNKSIFLQGFVEKLKEWNVQYKRVMHNEELNPQANRDVKGIFMSGGPGSPYQPLNLTADYVALINYDVPILGACLGHEVIGAAYGGLISKRDSRYVGPEIVRVKKRDKLLEGLADEIFLEKKHYFYLSQIPQDFELLADSKGCPTEIIRHKRKPIYGFQSHPEASDPDGLLIIRNFFDMCDIKYSC